ncbi:MAG: NAD-dependent protein deacylase [Clostridia bacterium]|nr:NAD-dependent protein deacylase [Clostridia bacterium]
MDKRLFEILKKSKSAVFFGGAGVSTESNIPDFRSEKGLYHAKEVYGLPPEELLSHEFFMNSTEKFFEYYRENLVYPDALPNKAHIALSKLEEIGKLKAVITQNIDGLHQKAGSKNVYELHGAVSRNRCMRCRKFYDLDYVMSAPGVPKCECGGIVKPEVVLYDESLDERQINGALNAIMNCDTLIIGGTSLAVYPAAGFVRYFRGNNLVLINMQETPFDRNCDLVIHEKIGEVMNLTDEELEMLR